MRVFAIFISIFFFSCGGTKTLDTQSSPLIEKDAFESILDDHFNNQDLQYQKIDSLLNVIFSSDFSLCNFYAYKADYYRKYAKKPLKALDELWMYNDLSIKNERYIFHSLLRNWDFQDTENKKNWYACIMLLPKKDCEDGDYHLRMNRIPWILRDTSNVENSIRVLDHVADLLQESCSTNKHFLREEVEWRKNIYEAAVLQLPLLIGEYEEYVEDVHWLMKHLPDSLTTNYAYNYIMEHELSGKELELPDNLFDLIDDRAFSIESYADYKGPSISLTAQQIDKLIEKADQQKTKTNCDWCDSFIKRMTYAKDKIPN